MKEQYSRKYRRDILRGVGAVGAVGLAGCLGDDDDDDADDGDDTTPADDSDDMADDGDDADDAPQDATELVVGTAAEATANFQAFNGFASLINESTDEVYLDVRPTDGMVANIGMMDRGELDAGLFTTQIASEIRDEVEPFDNLSFQPSQIFHTASTDWLLVTEDEDIQTFEDLEGATIGPGPAGTSVIEYFEYVLDLLEIDYESIEPTGFGDIGSALAEGRIDVGLSATNNAGTQPIQPGWVDPIQGTVDVHIIGVSDDHMDILMEDPYVEIVEFDDDDIADGYTDVPSPIRAFVAATYLGGPVDLDYDAVYTTLETAWENRDQLGDYHEFGVMHQQDEHWVDWAFEGIPFHAAAADFYEEVGLWNDDWERAD